MPDNAYTNPLNIEVNETDSIVMGLVQLYNENLDQTILGIEKLPESGSSRQYFRIRHDEGTLIAAYNANTAENRTFISFSQQLRNMGFNVPSILKVSGDETMYLMEDLGDMTLSLYQREKSIEAVERAYRITLDQLIDLQIAGGNIDFSGITHRLIFDKQSMLWDLNYFKYLFLRTNGIGFNEDRLETDFDTMTSLLTQADSQFFMFRDFQSRNVMLSDRGVFFIDYQGGRLGGLQYDVTSIINDIEADLPFDLRQRLLEYYIHRASQRIPNFNPETFMQYYPMYALLRISQNFGVFGLKGMIEGKPSFRDSIPLGQKTLAWWLEEYNVKDSIPELCRSLESITLRKF